MWGREALSCDFLRATVFIVLLRARKTLPHGKRLPQRSQNSPRNPGARKCRLGIDLCFTAKPYRGDRRGRRGNPGQRILSRNSSVLYSQRLPQRSQGPPRKSGAKNTVSEFFCALQPKITAAIAGSAEQAWQALGDGAKTTGFASSTR